MLTQTDRIGLCKSINWKYNLIKTRTMEVQPSVFPPASIRGARAAVASDNALPNSSCFSSSADERQAIAE